jgi:hypothetical protein
MVMLQPDTERDLDSRRPSAQNVCHGRGECRMDPAFSARLVLLLAFSIPVLNATIAILLSLVR